MALTYNQLVAEVPVILLSTNRTLIDYMGLVIRQAEDEIIQRLDHDAFRTKLNNVSVDPSNRRIDLSNEASPILEVRALRLVTPDGTYPIERRDIERLNATFNVSDMGMPRFYGESDAPLIYDLYPLPDTAYQVEITANVTPTRLSVETQESILTQRYARLTEMAVLKHAARFMRNGADEQRYGAEMMAALDETMLQMERRRRDESGVRTQRPENVAG